MHLCCESKSEIFGVFLIRIQSFSGKKLVSTVLKYSLIKIKIVKFVAWKFTEEVFLLQFPEVNFSWPNFVVDPD
jgi:hypothetical protein